MAKFNHGIFSKARKKLGGVVFQQYEGMQIGREYQPAVKNPQTTLQVGSRAAFKLASQFVGRYKAPLTLAAAIYSPYERYQRGECVRIIRRVCDIQAESASLKFNDAINALNNRFINTDVPAPVITGSASDNWTINATQGDEIVYTVLAIDADNNIIAQSTSTVNSTGVAQSIELPVLPPSASAATYECVAVAIRAITTTGAAYLDQMIGSYSVDAVRLVNTGDLKSSLLVNSSVDAA